MRLTFEQICAVATGVDRVTQEKDGIHFHRFTQEQELLYENRSDFLMKAFCTSGVCLRFRTDSKCLSLEVNAVKGCGRTYFSFDIFVNGKLTACLDNYSSGVLPRDYTTAVFPLGQYSTETDLGEGEKEVCIYFPWSVNGVLRELTLDDGASVIPVKWDKKLLCFGDSITHGYDALRPSSKYATRIADFLGAEEYNKAIGAEVFFPDLADTREGFSPDYITVAYGTNDWFRGTRDQFTADCGSFYEKLSATYPDAVIYAITPIWRKDSLEPTAVGPFAEIAQRITEVAVNLPNVKVIRGIHLVPHDETYYADLRLHPNDAGFSAYFDALARAIR